MQLDDGLDEGQMRTGSPPPAPEPLRVDVVDSHCHLDAMGVEVGAAVAAARAVGVSRLVTVGDTVASSQWCAQTAAAHDAVYAAVAVHPNETAGFDGSAAAEIDRLAALPQVRAVGETGLDYYWDRVAPAVQQAAFRQHIAIAKAHRKALVIHDRDAHADILRILEEEGAPERTVFHCFSGDADMAKVCASNGYLMSFAGNVTFKSAGALRSALSVVPEHLLLVETDAPFLTPVPFRGRPNAPYLVPLTIRAMAQVKGVKEDALAEAVATNSERVFGPLASPDPKRA
jgi:TatD DNase family protein